jgi:glutamyl-tRNA reductase
VVTRNQEARREMAAEAEGLLEEESRLFLEWWDGLEAVPVVNRLRRQLEDIREQELQNIRPAVLQYKATCKPYLHQHCRQ